MAKKSILITGIYGLVGSVIYKQLHKSPDNYAVYGVDLSAENSDRVSRDEAISLDPKHFYQSDLSDIESLSKMFEGIHTVVHMAADPNTEAPWESVLKNNICGTYNVLEASKRAKVRRVVVASTIQVSTGHFRRTEPYKHIANGDFDKVPEGFESLKTTERSWPVNLYAASKVFSETLARVYSSSSDLSCLCIRIGTVNAGDKHPEHLNSIYCSRNDMGRLAEHCILAPESLKFEVYYAMSGNKHLWVDMENAKQSLGFVPEDKSNYYS